MWVKNVQVYLFETPFTLTAEQLSNALEKFAFSPIGQLQESTFGWIPPMADGNMLCESIQTNLFFAAQKQEKILPSSVINEYLVERLSEIEQEEGRRPGRKERQQLKEDIRAQLLPKAFNKTKRIHAWIDTRNQWLIVDTSSESLADDFTAALREAVGSLAITPLHNSTAASDLLTRWYLHSDQRPNSITPESDLELVLLQDPNVKARYKNLAIDAPEIQHSLDSGMRIKQMAINYLDDIQCVLNDKLHVKRVKFSDALSERAQNEEDERAELILMIDSVTNLVTELKSSLPERN